mmetsp:Transcript_7354/g.8491  ORF Transcript_7354/g.8491 Transcript_7354/m.8491 type:complete len:150 (-) Transcript_7354:64-513(-)
MAEYVEMDKLGGERDIGGDRGREADKIAQQLSTTDITEDSEHPLVQRMRMLVNRKMKVELSDGRIMVGVLHCLDKQGNILIHETIEYRPPQGNGEWWTGERCQLGIVLVPQNHCVSAAFDICTTEAEQEFCNLDPKKIVEAGPVRYDST